MVDGNQNERIDVQRHPSTKQNTNRLLDVKQMVIKLKAKW